MTSKEALKNIKTLSYCKQHITIQEWCNIIEQDLDRLEKLEKEYKEARKSIKSWNENGGELLRENAKLKKVIEIMVDKKVSQFWIVMSESVDRYNAVMGKNYILTQEEYELLKEYL